jgi:hypothetical protein
MGIALVSGDGRRASGLRCGLREAILWLPIAAVFTPDTYALIQDYVAGPVFVALPYLAPLAVLAVQVGYASLHSGRLLHDRIARTYLVPR